MASAVVHVAVRLVALAGIAAAVIPSALACTGAGGTERSEVVIDLADWPPAPATLNAWIESHPAIVRGVIITSSTYRVGDLPGSDDAYATVAAVPTSTPPKPHVVPSRTDYMAQPLGTRYQFRVDEVLRGDGFAVGEVIAVGAAAYRHGGRTYVRPGDRMLPEDTELVMFLFGPMPRLQADQSVSFPWGRFTVGQGGNLRALDATWGTEPVVRELESMNLDTLRARLQD